MASTSPSQHLISPVRELAARARCGQVFNYFRVWLLEQGFSLVGMYWVTGILAFCFSPIADNLTTALLMGAIVIALGGNNPDYVARCCTNIVVASNAGACLRLAITIPRGFCLPPGASPCLGRTLCRSANKKINERIFDDDGTRLIVG